MSIIKTKSFILITTVLIFLLSCHRDNKENKYWNKTKKIALFERNDTIKVFGGGMLKQVIFKKTKGNKLKILTDNLDTKLFLKELYDTSKSELIYIKEKDQFTIKNDFVNYTFLKYEKTFKWDSITLRYYNHNKKLLLQKTYNNKKKHDFDDFSFLIYMGIDDLYSPQTSTNDYILIELYLPDNTIKKAKATILPNYIGRIIFKNY